MSDVPILKRSKILYHVAQDGVIVFLCVILKGVYKYYSIHRNSGNIHRLNSGHLFRGGEECVAFLSLLFEFSNSWIYCFHVFILMTLDYLDGKTIHHFLLLYIAQD